MILWDPVKNGILLKERGVSFEEAAAAIQSESFHAIIENPARPNQFIFLLPLKKYTYAVPFILDKNGNIVLKTIYPSRKHHRQYGGKP